jgi:DNA-binding NarL/FixJ family response regulator
LADDNLEILEVIRKLLGSAFEIADTVVDSRTLLRVVEQVKPDAVILDLHMPHLNGIDAGEQIIRGGLAPAVVVLTMDAEARLVKQAIRSGIQGYVLKTDTTELAAAIHAVMRGQTYLSRGVPLR